MLAGKSEEWKKVDVLATATALVVRNIPCRVPDELEILVKRVVEAAQIVAAQTVACKERVMVGEERDTPAAEVKSVALTEPVA